MFHISSIAIGEPPMCTSCSVLFAVKKAIVAARKEIDNKDFFSLGMFIELHEVIVIARVTVKYGINTVWVIFQNLVTIISEKCVYYISTFH